VAFDEHKERGYRIVRYAISEDGSLTIWQMSWEAVARDIKQGKLAGTADGFEVYITDEAANLREYLRQTDDLAQWYLVRVLDVLDTTGMPAAANETGRSVDGHVHSEPMEGSNLWLYGCIATAQVTVRANEQ